MGFRSKWIHNLLDLVVNPCKMKDDPALLTSGTQTINKAPSISTSNDLYH